MAAENKEFERFQSLCEKSEFPHREEILNGLENGDYSLERSENFDVPSESLLTTYETRAKLLDRFQGSYAARLRSEVLAFCAELRKIPNDSVNLWTIAKDKATDFTIFFNSEKILGCLLTVDKSMVSEEDWEKLWNKKG